MTYVAGKTDMLNVNVSAAFKRETRVAAARVGLMMSEYVRCCVEVCSADPKLLELVRKRHEAKKEM